MYVCVQLFLQNLLPPTLICNSTSVYGSMLSVEQATETDEVKTTEFGSFQLINDPSGKRSLVKLR